MNYSLMTLSRYWKDCGNKEGDLSMSKSKKQNSVALARVERDVATIDQSKQELEKKA